MPITHQIDADANHPEAILHELRWLAHAEPVWSTGEYWLRTLFSKLSDHALMDAAHILADDWAWHGPPKRLGRRFEQLFTQLLEQLPEVRLLNHGFVVQDAQHTLGELDFLLARGDEIHHVEVAIKFYAGVGDTDERAQLNHWIGPSCQDRFDRKVNHLLTHQLTLPRTETGQKALEAANLPVPKHSLGVIFGHLMHPWNQQLIVPEAIHSSRHTCWATFSDYASAFRSLGRPYGSAYGWLLVPRQRWMAAEHEGPCISGLPSQISEPEQADCYALIPREGGLERARLFIMPNQYPKIAKAAALPEN